MGKEKEVKELMGETCSKMFSHLDQFKAAFQVGDYITAMEEIETIRKMSVFMGNANLHMMGLDPEVYRMLYEQ